MKTTVEIPDDLYRQAKAEAALRGRRLKDLIEEGLRFVLLAPVETDRPRSAGELMRHVRGSVDSGVADNAVRAGLAAERGGAKRYVMPTHDLGLRPGVDLTKALQLAYELEDEETIRKLDQRK